MQVVAKDISVAVWCDAENVVQTVRSVNPSCTEETSTVIARELHRIFADNYTEDRLRLAYPLAANPWKALTQSKVT